MLHQPLQKQTKHTIFHFHFLAQHSLLHDKIRTCQSPWQNMVNPFRFIKILSNCVMNCELWYYILLWSSIMPTTYLKVTTLAPRHLSSPIIYYFLMSNNAFLCQKMFSLLKQKLSLWLPLHFQVSRDYSKAYAKGQIISKSWLASCRFSQKTNGRIWFVCCEELKSKQIKFVRSFFGRS